jgi:hypothetical protein
MKLPDEKWRTLVSGPSLGGRRYRVIQPARPIEHAPLYMDRLGGQLMLNKEATGGWTSFCSWASRRRGGRRSGHACDTGPSTRCAYPPAPSRDRFWRRDNLDHLRWAIAADTGP